MYSTNMRIDYHSQMDIDSWSCEMRAQSDNAMSYSSGGQPPSLGDVRQMMVSEPSGSNQMYSDGQPPSVNDVGRREPSQSEPSCTRYNYEGSDAHEVQQPRISDVVVDEKRGINPELWQACAGPLVNVPAAGTPVIYFPQGHCEQVAASMKRDVDAQIQNYPNIAATFSFILHKVTLHADTKTDEVYAQMTLHPVPTFDKEALLRSEMQMKAHKPQTQFFCKTLTASDTSAQDGFSVPRQAAETLFPPLDYSMHEPAQELVARDLHHNAWKFRHIYRGTPKRHLLTSGWSLFESVKRLSAGDSVLFMRDKKEQLLLGIRRANRQPANLSSSVLSIDSMHIGILADVAHAAASNSPFFVSYNPWVASEFVIPLGKFQKGIYGNQKYIGMRFHKTFETQELETKRYMGTITGISDLDTKRWNNSRWRELQVSWDEDTPGERRNRVSVWEIEPVAVAAPFSILPTPPFYQPNDPTQWMLGNESAGLDLSLQLGLSTPSGGDRNFNMGVQI